jgi:uroporphyrinogen III methyltransferase/synthase
MDPARVPVRQPQVFLVGAGPGDPGLLTLRAVECLRQADLILHDRLVPARLLEHARPGARVVSVEELGADHAQRWPHVHEALIDATRQGLRAVHLKGGDATLFARAGEEMQALRDAGIAYEVVPGVTAALGAAACIEVPLTQRGLASAVAIVTGHQTGEGEGMDWEALARFPGTLVFYMCITHLDGIVTALLRHGKDPDTPAAVVHRATTPRQRTEVTTLRELPARAAEANLGPPALAIVGDVVSLRPAVSWFEARPLFGRHAVVTRPRGQAGALARRLEELGAAVSLLPTVEIAELDDYSLLDRALAELGSYDWLVFTSANGVHAFIARLRQVGRDLRALGGVQLAAIGPATAEALRGYHLGPDLVPEAYRSEDLAEALRERVRGGRVLLARADRGREVLREELSAVCAVEQVPVYCQRDVTEADPAVLGALERGEVDYVLLTSSNIARGLVRLLPAEALGQVRSGRTRLVTISPVTSAAVRELGLPVAGEAGVYTAEGVVEALVALEVSATSPPKG